MRLQPLKNLIKPIIVAAVFALAFLTYMYFIGIPKTKAAGYYQLAVQQAGLGDTQKANEYFQKAISAYPEELIVNAYQKYKLSLM